MNARSDVSVNFRVTCLNPPLDDCDGQPTVFGLQDKKGGLQAGLAQADGSLRFDFPLTAKPGQDGAVDFGGALAQGTPGARFVYLSLGYAGQAPGNWIKRIKVRLAGITGAQVEAAQAGGRLETALDGRGAATVALIGGWTVSVRPD